MKQSFELLAKLITLLDEFVSKKGNGEITLESFILWLNSEILLKSEHSHQNKQQHDNSKGHPGDINVKLTFYLNVLHKHFKFYSKKVLIDSDLVTMDGHFFLASLIHSDSMRKMELIKTNFSEIPTGIEVINRLLKKRFIEEFADPDDKRSKRVRITKKGRSEFMNTIPHVKKIIKIMAGQLTEEKKIQLVSLLDQLYDFHVSLHNEAKSLNLDQLVEKV